MNNPGTRPTRLSRREVIIRASWAITDASVLAAAGWSAALLRYDYSVSAATEPLVIWWVALGVVVWVLVGLVAGPYLVRHQRGSFEEVVDLARASILTALALGLIRVALDWFDGVPRSLPVSTPLFGLLAMLALRVVVRSYRLGRTQHSTTAKHAVVFGAGEGGRQLVRALVRSDDSPYKPVAILDDDPRKRRLRIDGVPVRGPRTQLAEVAEHADAKTLILAMPAADSGLVRELRETARQLDLDVLILPPVGAMIGHRPGGSDLRRVNLEDLLGRRPVELDEGAIADAVTGKRVLITGAGGSIGSEIARQVSRFSPAKLTLLDRDESSLHAVQMSLTGRALLNDGTLALADIRDASALHSIFEHERPQVVFHAAALKHLTLLEQFPLEAYQTNVLGTRNVLDAASGIAVEKFINISTDKAADPTSTLGFSKRVAERLTANHCQMNPDSRYVSVRFGNVLGSRGSVVEAFTKQIERGGPITVTHPDVTRYFMLIPEAAQLVLQAAAIGQPGQAMVLDMGQPMRIVDVANTLIELSGEAAIEIIYTGLRDGEKLSETLFSPREGPAPSQHPLINYVTVAPLPEPVAPPEQLTNASALSWMRHASTDLDFAEPAELWDRAQ